jgi:glycosyltransferase involved in cell wall biosynthesis
MPVFSPRVLHIGKLLPPEFGGMERYLDELLAAQRQSGLDAHALVHGTPLPEDPAWVRRVPIQASILFTPVALGFPAALSRAIRELRPDALHLHLPNPSALWALTLPSARALPWVVHWHSDIVTLRPWSLLGLVHWAVHYPFEQAILERADRIIVTSPPYLEASVPLSPWRDKCSTVPLGLADHHGGGSGVVSEACPTTPPFRLLSVGRLTQYKGFETLIRAVMGVPGVELTVVGDGEGRGALLSLINRLTPAGSISNVILAGAVSDEEKARLFQQADLFCLASRHRAEAFGLVVLEAMRAGVPSLVSDLPGSGLPWLIRTTGAGELAPPDDDAAWRAAILDLLADPERRGRMARAARAAFEEHFTIAASERGVARIYREAGVRSYPEPAAGTLVVIPARDEAATISSIVGSLREAGFRDILVIDDQSQDDTARLARNAGARVLRPPLPAGAWGAMQAGIRYALERGFSRVITMDADGQHEATGIPLLLEAAERGADVVIGACPARVSAARQLAWRYFRFLTGLGVQDLTSGFRCYSRRACGVLTGEEATLLDYQDLGLLMLLRDAGMTIVEVPVTMHSRVSGESRIFSSWFRMGRYMLESTVLSIARGRLRRLPSPRAASAAAES